MPFDKKTLDRLREEGDFGEGSKNEVYITSGAQTLIEDRWEDILFLFMTFENWDPDWDPNDLHEIGVFPFGDGEIMFKIEPVDLAQDIFKITFLLPEEW